MAAVDDLRLAWFAEREGKASRRDALLTLAIADAGAAASAWAGWVRDRLIAGRPDHLFAGHATVEAALADPRVADRVARLRSAFPPGRVRWLLQRADAARGPYTGRLAGLGPLLDDLLGPAAGPAAAVTPSMLDRLGVPPTADPLVVVQLSMLLSVALLLDLAIRPADAGSRAA